MMRVAFEIRPEVLEMAEGRKPRRRPVLVLALLVLLTAAGGLYYHHYERLHEGEGPLVLFGNVDIREADLAFNVSGLLKAIEVEEGDRVAAGRLLARLDDAPYRAEVARAEAELARTQATLRRLENGSRPQEIARVRARAAALKARLRQAIADLKRTRALVGNDFASRQQLDAQQALVDSLKADIEAAEADLSLAVEGPRKEDIAAARAARDAAKAALDLARTRLSYATLKAESGGIIKTRIAEPGAVVGPGVPVLTLAFDDPLWVRTYVPESDLPRVHPGQKARIEADGLPDRDFEGWVGFISPVAEFTPKSVETPKLRVSLVYRLRVYVRDPKGLLRQGQPVTVRLVGEGEAGDDGGE